MGLGLLNTSYCHFRCVWIAFSCNINGEWVWSIPLLEEFSQMVVLSGVFLFGDVSRWSPELPSNFNYCVAL